MVIVIPKPKLIQNVNSMIIQKVNDNKWVGLAPRVEATMPMKETIL